MKPIMRIPQFLLVLAAALSLRAEPVLPPDARLAILGDSITEQKLYSKYIETYLLACSGRSDIRVFQFGWSGERAGGFAQRLENDLSVFNPNAATICYGMNDGRYQPFSDEIAEEYESNMRLVLDGLKNAGVRLVVVGSPGAVDPDFFNRPTVAGDVYNQTLAKLRDIGQKLAGERGMPFANVHDTMTGALAKSKGALGRDYFPFGADGFHPAPAGQLLMAEAFLKALGMDGEIGVITVDMKGPPEASAGHKIQPAKLPHGKVRVISERWPFCFDGDAADSGGNRSILPFTRFNEDLNRFTLKVKNLEAPRAEVVWGESVKEFSRERLEAGVNLAAEFDETPFHEAFAGLNFAVGLKQMYETMLVKSLVTHMRVIAEEAADEPKVAAALATLKKRLAAEHAKHDENVRKHLLPITHTIMVREKL
jgi:lysophospholipase L1-like esterase